MFNRAKAHWRCVWLVSLLGCDQREPLLEPPAQRMSSEDARASQPISPTGDFDPRHWRIAFMRNRTETQDTQLDLWNARKEKGYELRGVDTDTCNFEESGVVPVQAQWLFDELCTRCTVRVKWDPKLRTPDNIGIALHKILYKCLGDLSSRDIFEHLEEASQKDHTEFELKGAIGRFHVTTDRMGESEVLFLFDSLPMKFSNDSLSISRQRKPERPAVAKYSELVMKIRGKSDGETAFVLFMNEVKDKQDWYTCWTECSFESERVRVLWSVPDDVHTGGQCEAKIKLPLRDDEWTIDAAEKAIGNDGNGLLFVGHTYNSVLTEAIAGRPSTEVISGVKFYAAQLVNEEDQERTISCLFSFDLQ